MKHVALFGVVLALVACGGGDAPPQQGPVQQNPVAQQPVDDVELDMSTRPGAIAALQKSSAASTLSAVSQPVKVVVGQSRTGLTFTATGAAVVCNDTANNLRYLSRSFTVTNNTGKTLTNLQLHAYTKPGNANGTALNSLSGFGGAATPDPSQALPRHGMRCDSALPLAPDSLRADLQLYSAADLADRTALMTDLPAGSYLLGYGFLAQQRSTDTDTDHNPRTLAQGETAQVTVAFRVPVGTDAVYSFKTSFVLFTGDSRQELVQTPEDQRAGTTAGLAVLPTGSARVGVLGGAACGLTGSNRFQTSVLVAKTANTEVTDRELDVPPGITTITSAASSGPGSLQEAISNAAAGAALCFDQEILAIGLTIDRDLTLLGGENAALNGQNSFRVLQITAGTVNLSGFRIYNGRSDVGAGIHNAGNLILRNMRIVANTAGSDAEARGGGIFSTGPVQLYDTTVSGNAAVGDPGAADTGAGAATGGAASGGGVYLLNASLKLVRSTITQNQTVGGQGGAGRHGVEEIQGTEPPGFAFCSVIPTSGGSGGNAEGGGVYKGGSSTVENTEGVFNNASVGGDGGPGGDTPGVCSQYSSNLGSFGNRGPEDIAP